jgi:nucleotide-binding universal stress UspA family protein
MVVRALTGDSERNRKEASMDGSIVCGVDGSADSQAALAVAARMADRLETRLVLAHVVEYVQAPYAAIGAMGAGAMSWPLTPITDEQEEAGERLLAQMADEAGLDQAERRVVSGLAADSLADLADEEEAELIVVGSRGRGAFKAAFLGSVSTSLIGVARCPILVVPPGVGQR